ncbi:MAG: hypothetical protein CBC05_08695 [Crocinitomicaceae bacterium TMED45]|nr:MAG: hypothetical protein CBC05_08695 [Crocinitomicaceae bacterium TMED45]|tara:strand:- start:14915 stop:15133 length:219 start_codon:yes stop_codon:yes gene_type:complete
MRTTQRELREGNPTIDEMRYDLAEQEAMNISVSQMIQYIIDGFEGLDNIPDIEIREEWEEIFGELKNWDTNK